MPIDTETLRVADNTHRNRFELEVRNELVGILGYVDLRFLTEPLSLEDRSGPRSHGVVMSLMHTVMAEEFEDSGLATVLVRQSLEIARGYGWTVRPVCPYVAEFLTAHPEYHDLIADVSA
ncbi:MULTISPECIES: GNAT family N-acetyltransferase [Rhodococcus]|uniref:N-acetyltransferase n=1 Tax=Rhodococcus pseudokoreensis TaxID=2811421 RepID=A0A974WBJ1_9NOCA|nr:MULTISPECIES: GNAT family N-acetyltransferase [Rhodococcus]MBV6756333.1 N-acetyltransferase [Rhodococcus opacus]QSE94829.1 N-acetyltransferase [Rhodococcus pseudokoreensis]